MPANEIHKNDIGTVFEITIKDGPLVIDISGATTKNILLKPPTGTLLTKAGVFVTDGTDGKIKYTTISGDLSEVGVWQVQGHIATPDGEWKSDILNVSVHDNL
jgi:hypothetical protein